MIKGGEGKEGRKRCREEVGGADRVKHREGWDGMERGRGGAES